MVIYQQLQTIAPRIGEQETGGRSRDRSPDGRAPNRTNHLNPLRMSVAPVATRSASLAQIRTSPYTCPTPSADAPVWPHRSPGHFGSCVRWSTPAPTRCCVLARSPARCPYLPPTIDCLPCFLDLGTLFSQMTIETTSRDPRLAAEFNSVACRSLQTPPQSAESLPVSVVLPWLRRLMIHTRIQHRLCGLD